MRYQKISAVIVDDEKGCIANLLYSLSRLCPDISVIATGNTLAEVMNNAGGQKIELAFLDVELFNTSIFSELQAMADVNFRIVFVTAYQQYALRAIKVEALDYIMKPLCEEDILACYSKINRHFRCSDQAPAASETIGDGKKKIVLRNLDKIYYVRWEDIHYMAGNGAYTEITFRSHEEILSIVICKVLNKIEDEFDDQRFFRVHKSYIVNLRKIQSVSTAGGLHVQMQDHKLIPVAKRRAHDFLDSLNKKH